MKRVAAAAGLVLLLPCVALAQRRSSVEIAPGAIWFSGMDLGSATATLERPGGGEFELFTTSTQLEPGFGPAISASFFVTERAALEAAFSYTRPGASTRVTGDAEDAASVTSEIGLQQYLVEGNLRWYLGSPRRAWRPFVRAGGGYLRQLDDSNAHVETGRTMQLGLGLDRSFRERTSGMLRRAGLRIDGRAVARSGGFDVDDSLRVGFSAGAAFFLGF